MDAGKAAIIGAAVGGSFSFLALVVNIPIQWLQQNWAASNERRKELLFRRLVAIQNCVKMIDFLAASKNANLGPKGHEEWVNIRVENNANGAFFPPELSDGFKALLRTALLRDSLADSEKVFDWEALEKLRKDCLSYIQREFETGA